MGMLRRMVILWKILVICLTVDSIVVLMTVPIREASELVNY